MFQIEPIEWSNSFSQVTVNGTSYHKSCFKCSHGGCTISPSNYIAHEGTLYCKHHHIQLIKQKGNYSKLEDEKEKTSDEAAAPPQEETSDAWSISTNAVSFCFLFYCCIPWRAISLVFDEMLLITKFVLLCLVFHNICRLWKKLLVDVVSAINFLIVFILGWNSCNFSIFLYVEHFGGWWRQWYLLFMERQECLPWICLSWAEWNFNYDEE